MACLLSTSRRSWETYHSATRKVNNNKHWHSWAVSEWIHTIVTDRYLICEVFLLINGGKWEGMGKLKKTELRDSHRWVAEVLGLTAYNAVSFGDLFPTFRKHIMPWVLIVNQSKFLRPIVRRHNATSRKTKILEFRDVKSSMCYLFE